MGGLPEDDVMLWRHELADVEAALEDVDAEGEDGLRLTALRDDLERRIAEGQNPVEASAAEVVVDADPEDFKPAGRDLVVAPGAERHDVLAVFDAHDEDMILEEMQRRALKVMLYEYSQGGEDIVDLSYQGVNECVRVLNATGKTRIKIDRESLTVEQERIDGVDYYVATVYSVEAITEYGQFGTAREPYMLKLKDERSARRQREKGNVVHERPVGDKTLYYVFDPFARTKAVNKAQRNALKVQVPERIRQALIAMAKKDASMLRTIQHGAGAEAMAELPAPLDTPDAKVLTEEIRGLYVQIRQEPGGVAGPTALLPGQFNMKLSRAAHDMALLESLRDELQSRLEHLRGPAVATAGERR